MATKSSLQARPARLQFHAVSIVPGKQCCAQVQALQGVRLLSARGAAPADRRLHDCRTSASAATSITKTAAAGSRRSDMRSSKSAQWELTGGDRRRAAGRRDSDYLDE